MSANTDKVSNKDWMFCPYTGSLLQLDAVKNIASSQLSGYSISLDGMLHMQTIDTCIILTKVASFIYEVYTRMHVIHVS